jgi:ligand-binding sensor domain-containing protein
MAGMTVTAFLYFKKSPHSGTLTLNNFRRQTVEKVTSFFHSEDGRVWLGSKQNGLMSVRPDKANQTFTNYVHYDSFGRDEITGFAPYDNHRLWISSHSGLYLFNTQTNKIEPNGRFLSDEIVYSIAMSRRTSHIMDRYLHQSIADRQRHHPGTHRLPARHAA